MIRIVLISCVSRKVGHKAKAKDLYKGPLFTSSLAFGQSLKPDKTFILSALHNLLGLIKEIEPYNVTLSKIKKNNIKKELRILSPDEKIEWGKKGINQLKNEANILSDEFIVLARKEYIEPIGSYISNLRMPLQGKSIGERIKFVQNQKKINYERNTSTIISQSYSFTNDYQ
jgi:hypothetical protein